MPACRIYGIWWITIRKDRNRSRTELSDYTKRGSVQKRTKNTKSGVEGTEFELWVKDLLKINDFLKNILI
jgi:hypothetical protein